MGTDGEITCTLYWMCYTLEEARVCIWGVGRPARPCCILQKIVTHLGCKIVLRVKEMPKAWETLMISLQIEESWSSGEMGLSSFFGD